MASELPQPDRITDNKRLRQVIDEAIAALPEEQREVFLLREVNGLQFKDIAEATGTGENTVKSRMRYAMLAMQKRLAAAGFVAGAAAVAEENAAAPERDGVVSSETPTGPPLGARGPPGAKAKGA